jgi:hypothetical protein
MSTFDDWGTVAEEWDFNPNIKIDKQSIPINRIKSNQFFYHGSNNDCDGFGKRCAPFQSTMSSNSLPSAVVNKPKSSKMDDLALRIAFIYKNPLLNSSNPTLAKNRGRNDDPLCKYRLALGRINKTYMHLLYGSSLEGVFSAVLNGGYITTTTIGNQSMCSELRETLVLKQSALDFRSSKFRQEIKGKNSQIPKDILDLSDEVKNVREEIKKYNPIIKKEINTSMLNAVKQAIDIFVKNDANSDKLSSLIKIKLGFYKTPELLQPVPKNRESCWGRSDTNNQRSYRSQQDVTHPDSLPYNSSRQDSSRYNSSCHDSSRYDKNAYFNINRLNTFVGKSTNKKSNLVIGSAQLNTSNRYSPLAEKVKKVPGYNELFPGLTDETILPAKSNRDELCNKWSKVVKSEKSTHDAVEIIKNVSSQVKYKTIISNDNKSCYDYEQDEYDEEDNHCDYCNDDSYDVEYDEKKMYYNEYDECDNEDENIE